LLRKKLDDIAGSKQTPQPSGLTCIAFKIVGGFTDSQYKFIYHNSLAQLLPESQQLYAPPSALKRAEVQLKPGYSKFVVKPPSPLFPSENDISDADCRTM
tara:strand:- start:82 stop:381 length:300 start_codon:yes stop_codon:yes gene_type:complete